MTDDERQKAEDAETLRRIRERNAGRTGRPARPKRPGRFPFLLMLLPVGYLVATILIGGGAMYMVGCP